MMDKASEIITNVEVTPGNQADGEAVDEMLTGTTVKPVMIMGHNDVHLPLRGKYNQDL